MIIFIASATVKSADLIDVNFTRDAEDWVSKFDNYTWNKAKTDFTVSGINGKVVNDFKLKGSFGKFNPGKGVYAQPLNREDFCEQFIWAFRISNTGDSYIELPEVESAGLLTLHCKSGNPVESALFYIERLEKGKWKRIKTLVAPAHGNQDLDVVLRQNLNLKYASKLRLYGASKNLHVFAIKLESYTETPAKKKNVRLIIMPDTQNAVQKFPHIFQSQTAWITNNSDSIDFVIHVGDITNANNEQQWKTAASGLSLMDNVVPYTFVPGNHDTGTHGSSDVRNTDLLNEYLPYGKYSKTPNFGGVFKVGHMENSWYTFKSEDGYKYLIVSLEFAPRNEVLDWAGKIIKAHAKYNVIINTHAYLYSDDNRISDLHGHKWTPAKYGLYKVSNGNANDGEQIWNKLVKKYKNVLMVVCGHVLNDGTGLLITKGDKGNTVYQMLSNYQSGVIDSKLGGSGFLRIMDIDAKQKKINVRSYSPFLDEYKTDFDQQFSFENVKLIK